MPHPGITATAGIGTNLYLCKVAMDIVAKHIPADKNGVRIAELDEMSYRKTLWSHQPLTDFWRVGKGYAKKLEENGMFTMGDVARRSVTDEDLLYKLFGKNAELLIDHAWGWEPCTIEAVKAYKPESISFRAEGQERFTRSKTIGENYTEERIKERIAGRTPRRSQRQATPKGISLIGDIQERIRFIDSKGYEHKAKLTILKEAARTLNYLTENNLLQYDDLEKTVEDVHSSYDRTGKELKVVEARLREVQPLIKNISNYQRLKPVYDAFQKTKDKPSFKAKHEAELVIFEAARSTLLAMQGDEKLPSLKTLQAEQQRLLEEQQRLYDERAKLKKEARMIDTLKANVDDFLKPVSEREQEQKRNNQIE